jgi:preprotein translocase subunit SecE
MSRAQLKRAHVAILALTAIGVFIFYALGVAAGR